MKKNSFFKTKFKSFVPTFTFWGQKISTSFVCCKVSFKTVFQNHHVNRAIDVETCCEEINVKYFVKWPFCLEPNRTPHHVVHMDWIFAHHLHQPIIERRQQFNPSLSLCGSDIQILFVCQNS